VSSAVMTEGLGFLGAGRARRWSDGRWPPRRSAGLVVGLLHQCSRRHSPASCATPTAGRPPRMRRRLPAHQLS